MATKYKDITGNLNSPDTSGSVFFEPTSVKFTNDIFGNLLVAIFNDTATKIGLLGRFRMPDDFVSGAYIGIEWTSTATSGNFIADIDYSAIGGSDAESLDVAAVQRNATGTQAAPSAALEKMTMEIAMTDADLLANDTVLLTLSRDGAAADTIAAAVIVVGVYLKYNNA